MTFDWDQNLDLEDLHFKTAIISIFKKLKGIIFKELEKHGSNGFTRKDSQ